MPARSRKPAFSHDGKWVAYHRVLDGQRDVWIVPAGRRHAHARLTQTIRSIDVHPAVVAG